MYSIFLTGMYFTVNISIEDHVVFYTFIVQRHSNPIQETVRLLILIFERPFESHVKLAWTVNQSADNFADKHFYFDREFSDSTSSYTPGHMPAISVHVNVDNEIYTLDDIGS